MAVIGSSDLVFTTRPTFQCTRPDVVSTIQENTRYGRKGQETRQGKVPMDVCSRARGLNKYGWLKGPKGGKV